MQPRNRSLWIAVAATLVLGLPACGGGNSATSDAGSGDSSTLDGHGGGPEASPGDSGEPGDGGQGNEGGPGNDGGEGKDGGAGGALNYPLLSTYNLGGNQAL